MALTSAGVSNTSWQWAPKVSPELGRSYAPLLVDWPAPGYAVETTTVFALGAPSAVDGFGGISTYLANKLGGLAFGGVAYTQPSCYAQPNEVQPGEDGTGSDVPDSGYSARVALTFDSPASRSVAASVPFTLYTASGVEELDSVAVFDSLTSGGSNNLLFLARPTAIHATVNGQLVRATALTLSFDASGLQTSLVNSLLSHVTGGTPHTPQTTIQVGLISGGTTELPTADGYARLTGIANDGTTWDTWADGETTNLIAFTFGPATANWASATRLGIWTGDGTTLMAIVDLPAPLAVTSGNYARIPAGRMTLRLTADFGPSLAEPVLDTWYDVTDAGISLADTVNGIESFGPQDVVADPARPQDLYASTCGQGVWKSTDYGKTWAKVSTTTVIDTGKLWTMCIDPDTSRNPATPPRLWTCNGVSIPQQGIFRSDDGGVTWTYKPTGGPSEDIYQVVCDPYDSDHLLCTFHGDPQVYESFNAGDTWAIGGVSPANGVSCYVFFVDTGSAGTTADTWLIVPQNGEGVGMRRTTNGGASWTTVISGASHPHGGCQIADLGGGSLVFASAGQGIYESTDYGANWTLVDASQTGIGFACLAGGYVWVWNSFPSHAGDAHRLRRRPAGGGSYVALTGVDTDLTNGFKTVAITSKGGRDVMVGTAWQAGIWRWVEP